MLRNLIVALSLFILTLVAACGGPRLVTESTVAEMDYVLVKSDGDFSLTLPQYYKWMVNSRFVASGGTISSEESRNYLDSMLIDTLNDIKAANLNLPEHRKYYRTFLLRYNALLQNEFLMTVLVPQIVLDSQDVIEYYEAHAAEYDLPEQVLIHHIYISPEAILAGKDSAYYRKSNPEVVQQAAESLAYFAYDQITVGKRPFTEVALEYSHDHDIQYTGGFLGWIVRQWYQPPFDSIAFGMEPGEISKPYRDPSGWHILLVKGKWAGGPPPLEDSLYQAVANKLLGERITEEARGMRDSLSYDLDLKYHDEVLDTNTLKVDDWEWAAELNGRDTIFFFHLKAMEQQYRSAYAVPQTNVMMKREMIRAAADELRLLQAAEDLKIDTLPEMAAIKQDLWQKYSRAYVDEALLDPAWTPTDSMIRAYYAKHAEDYRVEKPLTVQHIIVADSSTGAFVRDQARSGIDFLTLASQFYVGEPDMRAELANLGPINENDVPPEFWAAALNLLPGAISNPVRTKLGFHVIRLLDARFTPTVDKVRSEIIKALRDRHALENVEGYKQELYREFGIRIVGKVPSMHLKPARLRKEGA